MRIIPRKAGLVAVVAAVALGLAGCGSSGSTTGDGASGSASGGGSTQPVAVVTSTNVWGDIVAQVGGEDVSVTALAKDPAVESGAATGGAATGDAATGDAATGGPATRCAALPARPWPAFDSRRAPKLCAWEPPLAQNRLPW